MISYNPDDYEVEATIRRCVAHQRDRFTDHPGCTCSGTYSWKKKPKPPAHGMTAI